MANSQVDQLLSQCEAAYNASYTLTEDQKAEITNYIAELQANALENGYKNLDALLAEYYIEGITAETFEKCITLQQLAYSYMNKESEKIEAEPKSDELSIIDEEGEQIEDSVEESENRSRLIIDESEVNDSINSTEVSERYDDPSKSIKEMQI